IGLGTQVRDHLGSSFDFIHRSTSLLVLFGSLLVLLWITTKLSEDTRLVRWASVAAALAVAQVGLGVTMAYVALVPAAQVAHLTIASLLLGAETVLLLLTRPY